jgi:hypothetical protein
LSVFRVEQQTQELYKYVGQGQINTSGVVDVMAKSMHLLWKNYMDAIAEIRIIT